MTPPRISVLLLTRNGRATLPDVLDGLERQHVDRPVEVVALDSGSTDGTLDLLAGRVDRVVPVRPAEFNHGLTRNAGVSACRGDLVVLLVQDAVPVGRRWLASLIQPLLEDPSIAGTFARQQPRPDASPITRQYLCGWQGTSATPRTAAVASREEFLSRPPMEQFELCIFDNVCSCIRRSVWEQIPFPDTPIAEDLEWGRAALLAGYRLAYVPEAAVVHSHERSARYELNRTYLVHQRLYRLFGVRTIPTIRHLIRAVSTTIPAHLTCLRRDRSVRPPAREVVRTLVLALAFPVGQYLGGLSGRNGWRLLRAKGV